MRKQNRQQNQFVNYLQSKVTINNIIRYILTVGSTLAISAISYAGALAVGYGVSAGLAVFFLTGIISLQVNLELIDKAVEKLKNFSNNKFSVVLLDACILAMSILAAVSFGFTTLNASVALFSLNLSILISVVSALANFFISYQIMQKAKSYIEHFHEKYAKFNNNLQSKNWFLASVLRLSCILLFAATAFLMVINAPTFWLETGQGAAIFLSYLNRLNLGQRYVSAYFTMARFTLAIQAISSPFLIISNSLYYLINATKSMIKFSDFGVKLNYRQYYEHNKGLWLNPFFHIISLINSFTGFTLHTAHANSHSLYDGRTTMSSIVGTILDWLADANFTIAKQHNHSHEPFDFIVMLTKFIITTPIELLSIPTNICITKATSKNMSWMACIKKSFNESFASVKEYIASKHVHECNHDDTKSPKACVEQEMVTISPASTRSSIYHSSNMSPSISPTVVSKLILPELLTSGNKAYKP